MIFFLKGMHELLAPIVLVLQRETPKDYACSSEYSSEYVDLVCGVVSRDHIEHDAFWIFDHLMRDMSQFFISNNSKPAQ